MPSQPKGRQLLLRSQLQRRRPSGSFVFFSWAKSFVPALWRKSTDMSYLDNPQLSKYPPCSRPAARVEINTKCRCVFFLPYSFSSVTWFGSFRSTLTRADLGSVIVSRPASVADLSLREPSRLRSPYAHSCMTILSCLPYRGQYALQYVSTFRRHASCTLDERTYSPTLLLPSETLSHELRGHPRPGRAPSD